MVRLKKRGLTLFFAWFFLDLQATSDLRSHDSLGNIFHHWDGLKVKVHQKELVDYRVSNHQTFQVPKMEKSSTI